MSDTLTQRLRSLARGEHDDLSVGEEAADEIERLTAALDEPPAPQTEDDGWPEAISNGLALPCSLCGQKPSFDYGVHDEIWGRIAPAEHRLSVICLPCLDSLGAEAGISVGSHLIEVQFTGRGHTTVLRPAKSYFYTPQTDSED